MSDEKRCGTCVHWHTSENPERERGICNWHYDTDTPFWLHGSNVVDPERDGKRCHTWEAKS